jgi:8-oxo-dGTP pyrophosphatase MutT (NUDIX family)
VTVAAIIERDRRFLFVEAVPDDGLAVFNQPAGHLDFGESLIEAVKREVLEETAWRFEPEGLVGLYLYTRHTDVTYLRVCFHGRPLREEPERPLDQGIIRAVWLTRAEFADVAARQRSPMVMRGLDDYLAGKRYPLDILSCYPWPP